MRPAAILLITITLALPTSAQPRRRRPSFDGVTPPSGQAWYCYTSRGNGFCERSEADCEVGRGSLADRGAPVPPACVRAERVFCARLVEQRGLTTFACAPTRRLCDARREAIFVRNRYLARSTARWAADHRVRVSTCGPVGTIAEAGGAGP